MALFFNRCHEMLRPHWRRMIERGPTDVIELFGAHYVFLDVSLCDYMPIELLAMFWNVLGLDVYRRFDLFSVVFSCCCIRTAWEWCKATIVQGWLGPWQPPLRSDLSGNTCHVVGIIALWVVTIVSHLRVDSVSRLTVGCPVWYILNIGFMLFTNFIMLLLSLVLL